MFYYKQKNTHIFPTFPRISPIPPQPPRPLDSLPCLSRRYRTHRTSRWWRTTSTEATARCLYKSPSVDGWPWRSVDLQDGVDVGRSCSVCCVFFGCFFVGKYLMGKNGNVCQGVSEYRHNENKCRCVLVCMLACMHACIHYSYNDTIMHTLKHQQIDVTQKSSIFLELHKK